MSVPEGDNEEGGTMNQREFVRLMEDTFRRLNTEARIDDSAEEAWATAYTDIKRLGRWLRWLREGSPFYPLRAELVEDIIESLFETRFYLDHDPDEVRAGGAVAKSRFVARVFADEILAPWEAGTDETRKTFARFQKIDRAGEDRKERLWDFIMARRSWIQSYFANRDVRGRINDLIVYLFRLYGMLAEQGVEALVAPGAEVVGCVTDEVARIRAERVRIVGNDCCHGSDPACAAGCIFAEAVRNIISNVEPEPAPGAEPVGYGVLVHGYDESKPPAIGRARDKWKVDEFFYPFQRAKAVEACKELVPEARAHVVPLYASPPSERAGPKPEPIGRCADCGSHETPVGEYPLTSCISCGAPWRNYAREERAGERETALREALEEIAAFGCGWDRSNVNPCTKRYASRKEWCAPCIARRALAASPGPSGGETR